MRTPSTHAKPNIGLARGTCSCRRCNLALSFRAADEASTTAERVCDMVHTVSLWGEGVIAIMPSWNGELHVHTEYGAITDGT